MHHYHTHGQDTQTWRTWQDSDGGGSSTGIRLSFFGGGAGAEGGSTKQTWLLFLLLVLVLGIGVGVVGRVLITGDDAGFFGQQAKFSGQIVAAADAAVIGGFRALAGVSWIQGDIGLTPRFGV